MADKPQKPRKRHYLLEAIALVKWDGYKWTHTGVPYHERHESDKLHCRTMARRIIKIIDVAKKLKAGKEAS